MRKWRAFKALVHDGVDATLELVREGHESTSRVVLRFTDDIDPLRDPARAMNTVRRVGTDAVLGTIRVVNRTVEVITDRGLDLATASTTHTPETPLPMSSDVAGSLAWLGDAAIGALNAAVGDHLVDADNGLDLDMMLRIGDAYVAVEPEAMAKALVDAGPRVAVFLHGLGATEWSWCLEAEAYHGDPRACFGTLLERDLGFTPVYVRYNTGRHVSENGRRFAALLEEFVALYPVPIEDLTLVGHSMGGLVARSACDYGEREGRAWPAQVKRVFYLGSPHRGAPLAKFGHVLADVLTAIDLPATRITGRILDGRSNGVKDLRHGGLVDEEWLTPHAIADRDELPIAGARHVFVSATVTRDPAHPVGRLIGDLMVRVPSATGPTAREASFAIDTGHYGGVLHHHLQNHPAVYEQVRAICEGSKE